jgi:hypothetical protein
MACRKVRPSTGEFGDESREMERGNVRAMGRMIRGAGGASRRGHGPVFIEQGSSSLLSKFERD